MLVFLKGASTVLITNNGQPTPLLRSWHNQKKCMFATIDRKLVISCIDQPSTTQGGTGGVLYVCTSTYIQIPCLPF